MYYVCQILPNFSFAQEKNEGFTHIHRLNTLKCLPKATSSRVGVHMFILKQRRLFFTGSIAQCSLQLKCSVL